MKVSAINFIPISATAQKTFPKKMGVSSVDVFEKSSAVSFSGSQDRFDKKIASFASDLRPIIMQEEFDFEKVKSVLQKYAPDVQVKSLDELGDDVMRSKRTMGYIKAPFYLEPGATQMQLLEKTIFISFPIDNSEEEKVRVLKNTVHEFSHALQLDMGDKSKLTITNNYLRGKSLNGEVINSIQHCNDIFKHIEDEIMLPLLYALQKENNNPTPIPLANDSVLNSKMLFQTGKSSDEYIKNTALNYLNAFEGKFGKMNRKFVLSYVKLAMENEAEAYNYENNIAKKVLEINGDTDSDLITLLHSKAAKVLGDMARVAR